MLRAHRLSRISAATIVSLALIAPVAPTAFAAGTSLGTTSATSIAVNASSNVLVNDALGSSDKLQISGFSTAANDKVRVVISVIEGTVQLTEASGLSALTKVSPGYANSTTITDAGKQIAFEASQSDANTALNGLQYNAAATGSTSNLTIDVSYVGSGGVSYNPDNGHYYRVVTSQATWTAAEAAATALKFNGLTGYLVTITSASESLFAKDKVGNSQVWIGASDSAAEGVWRWVTGPEAGTQFWAGAAAGVVTAPYNYANWAASEPNNSGSTEHYGQMVLGDGTWNDLDENRSLAYVVEYGGLPGETQDYASVQRTVSVTTVVAPSQPQNVTATVTSRVFTPILTLTWDAPNSNGGSAITSYQVTGTPGSLSCTVTAAPLSCEFSGSYSTTYSFSVTATNMKGTSNAGTASATTFAAPPDPMLPLAAPTVTLTGSTLSCVAPGFSQTPQAMEYVLMANGVVVDRKMFANNTTSTTFAVPSSVSGQTISCRVTGTAKSAIGTAEAAVAKAPTVPVTPTVPTRPTTPTTPGTALQPTQARVTFALLSSSLTLGERAELRALVKAGYRTFSVTTVVPAGRSKAVQSYNVNLSRKRAAAISNYLLSVNSEVKVTTRAGLTSTSTARTAGTTATVQARP